MLHLLLHTKLAAQKVEVLDRQAERFALAESGCRRHDGEGPVTLRNGVDQREYLFCGPRNER